MLSLLSSLVSSPHRFIFESSIQYSLTGSSSTLPSPGPFSTPLPLTATHPPQPHLPRCQWSWATNADRFIYFLFIYLLLLDTLIPLRWKEINVFHLRISINETQKSELPKYFRRNKTVLWAGHVCPRQAGEGLAAGQGLICRGYIFYSLKKTRDQKTKTSAISLI